MQRLLKLLLLAAVALSFAATAAFAHAFLDKAVPGVGTTVALSPSELKLTFSEKVVPAFSGVRIAAIGGKPIASDKPVVDRAKQNVLHVHLLHPLRPGTYVVSWHVVSVDTHRTQGTYKFTVAH
jgi:methionine-rich copper-binding protein CopC